MTSFEGRVALVTGASGGIGRRIAERLAGAGATLALHYASSFEAVEELAAAIGQAAIFEADLGDAKAPDRLVDEVEATLGPVDVLVANHGRTQVAKLEQVSAPPRPPRGGRRPRGRRTRQRLHDQPGDLARRRDAPALTALPC
jgi:NAD(P)-dependent dehydrogenase (short-subunit alcohol dehydrogenase family)